MTQQYRLQAEHEALNQRLKQTIRFTEEDLVANRNGQLSPSQQIQLRTQREAYSGMAWGCGLVGVLILCMMVTLAVLPPKSDSSELLPALLFVGCFVVIGLMIQTGFTKDMQNSTVMSARGPVKKQSSGGRSYYIVSDLTSIQVSREVYDAFVEGLPYVLYYTPNSMTLVAAEYILPF